MWRCRTLSLPLSFAWSLLIGLHAAQAQCVLPNQLANGQIADADQVMANYDAIAACLGAMSPGGSVNSVQYKSGAGALGGIGPLTDGQTVIGSTATAPQAQTLSAGAGIAITHGPGSISIAAAGTPVGAGLYRQVMSAIPTSGDTGLTNWLNQGTSTVADTTVGITMDVPPIGTTVANVTGRYMPAPTPPYTIKALVGATRSSTSPNAVGIGWYDGTNKLHLFSLTALSGGGPSLEVLKYNSPTSYSATDAGSPPNGFSQPIWMQLRDDGTNVSFSFSQDGANYLPLFSVAKSSGFLGAAGYNNVIFFTNPRGDSRTIATLLSWKQS